MKIYFACSITGGRKDEKIYQQLVRALLEGGNQVPTAHIADSGVEEMDARDDPLDIYQRDVDWIQESDLLIAEVTTPSHGVGYEIGYALGLGKPVLCLHREDTTISKMISGNPDPLLTVSGYRSAAHALERLADYLSAQHQANQS
jgi:nucleoside 2-deoxyribosyltransferase